MLKQPFSSMSYSSPLAEGRELKSLEAVFVAIDPLSPLAEGRELKLRYWQSGEKYHRRPSRRGVN